MTINKVAPLADTNVLISFFAEDNNFDIAKDCIYQQGVYINDYIVCELLNNLQKLVHSKYALQVFKKIFGSVETYNFLDITDKQRDKASEIMEKYLDNNFTFTDCLILAQAEEYGLKVYTSDIRMQNYKNVEVINPFGSKNYD